MPLVARDLYLPLALAMEKEVVVVVVPVLGTRPQGDEQSKTLSLAFWILSARWPASLYLPPTCPDFVHTQKHKSPTEIQK
jgi:hypothetical protein